MERVLKRHISTGLCSFQIKIQNWFYLKLHLILLSFVLIFSLHFFIGKEPDVAAWRVRIFFLFRTIFQWPFSLFPMLYMYQTSLKHSQKIVWLVFEFIAFAFFVIQIQYNDRPNAELIMHSKNKADLVIESIDL